MDIETHVISQNNDRFSGLLCLLSKWSVSTIARNNRFHFWVKIKTLFIIAYLLFIANAHAQEPLKIVEPVFKAGEQLSYKLKYGWFTGAEAHLRVEEADKKFEGRSVWHIIAEGNTAGTFDVFYKVRNRYDSYIDRSTLLPYLYTEDRHEAKYKHTDHVVFNHQTNKITANKGVFPFQGKVFDFPSAYYFARCLDVAKLKPGDKFELSYFLDDGIQKLGITYAGKEKMDCSLGKFNCLKFNPTIIPGRIFKKNSKLYLWISDDENRIPIKAHVDLIVGSVTMDLTEAKGLKYPLNPLSK
ncbi:DUF3108 domain-containing protein [Mucilaginibacter robiniae]|uniref:DUF3108 domain-containing protein n=1 Tax=Mucilaginibacter robiniae TaxID=2728022 RepID=A0A7L5E070_9SPHI|nr:DUF3108 domain-containing protein [Mucilaginibacter robiniae]QJD95679.1 DUF3108 domain-containing protein [Mucilaginibacter robiniae]